MSQQVITNLEGGLAVRTALNAMMTELYSYLVQSLVLDSVSTNQEQQIPAGNFLKAIYIKQISGTPTVSIGSTGGAQDVFPTTVINAFNQTTVEEFYTTPTNLFVTITGGTVSIYFDTKAIPF